MIISRKTKTRIRSRYRVVVVRGNGWKTILVSSLFLIFASIIGAYFGHHFSEQSYYHRTEIEEKTKRDKLKASLTLIRGLIVDQREKLEGHQLRLDTLMTKLHQKDSITNLYLLPAPVYYSPEVRFETLIPQEQVGILTKYGALIYYQKAFNCTKLVTRFCNEIGFYVDNIIFGFSASPVVNQIFATLDDRYQSLNGQIWIARDYYFHAEVATYRLLSDLGESTALPKALILELHEMEGSNSGTFAIMRKRPEDLLADGFKQLIVTCNPDTVLVFTVR